MAAKYVWIYDFNGALVGMWVTGSLAKDSNRDNILGMAVAERGSSIEAAGQDAADMGFTAVNHNAFANRKYREVPNTATEIGTNTFQGGAFLMLGDTRSPSEVKDSANTYVVREAGGSFGIIQVKPLPDAPSPTSDSPGTSVKRWWQLWR